MKAQTSSEFMVVFTALSLLFVVVFVIYFGASINLFQAQDSVAALRNAYAAAAALNYVYLAGDGASYNFSLSGIVNGENITVGDFAVTSERPRSSAAAPLLGADVNVSSLNRGAMVITNRGGGVYVGN